MIWVEVENFLYTDINGNVLSAPIDSITGGGGTMSSFFIDDETPGSAEEITEGNTITFLGTGVIDADITGIDNVTYTITPGGEGQILKTTGGVAAWDDASSIVTADNGLSIAGDGDVILGGDLDDDTDIQLDDFEFTITDATSSLGSYTLSFDNGIVDWDFASSSGTLSPSATFDELGFLFRMDGSGVNDYSQVNVTIDKAQLQYGSGDPSGLTRVLTQYRSGYTVGGNAVISMEGLQEHVNDACCWFCWPVCRGLVYKYRHICRRGSFSS